MKKNIFFLICCLMLIISCKTTENKNAQSELKTTPTDEVSTNVPVALSDSAKEAAEITAQIEKYTIPNPSGKVFTAQDFEKIENINYVTPRENGFFAVWYKGEKVIIYNEKGEVELLPPLYYDNYCKLVKIYGELYIQVNDGFAQKTEKVTFYRHGREVKEINGKAIELIPKSEIKIFYGLTEIPADTEEYALTESEIWADQD
ncbi:MAG: hypothetical protein PHE89_03455 [Alphaproteobacteria bacterium]|nr:hypothetical protein [Alphaproteobacteria bacterium]